MREVTSSPPVERKEEGRRESLHHTWNCGANVGAIRAHPDLAWKILDRNAWVDFCKVSVAKPTSEMEWLQTHLKIVYRKERSVVVTSLDGACNASCIAGAADEASWSSN